MVLICGWHRVKFNEMSALIKSDHFIRQVFKNIHQGNAGPTYSRIREKKKMSESLQPTLAFNHRRLTSTGLFLSLKPTRTLDKIHKATLGNRQSRTEIS